MLSYTERRNLFGTLANNTESSNLAMADILMNNSEKALLSSKQWPFLEKQFTLLTDASNQFVALPMYVDRVSSVYLTIGDQTYVPDECPSRQMWDLLNQNTEISDIPEYFFVYDGKLGLFPRPASSSNVVTVNSKILPKDLSITDYSAGTIITATNGGTTIVGNGTTWTSQMAGRWIRITDSNNTNTGDGYWYQILSVQSTTSLTLTRKYAGTTISAGTASYVIAQCSLLPEAYQNLPVYEALSIYFLSVDPESDRSDRYKRLFEEGKIQLMADHGSKTQNVVIDPGFCDEQSEPYPNVRT